MKVYLYDGIEYTNVGILRQIIWRKSNLLLPSKVRDEDWSKYGVAVEEKEVVLTEDQLAQQARTKRDALLSKSDFYVMPDYPATEEDLDEVKKYRQALRDITDQYGFPYMVSWPTKPEVL